MIAWVYERAAQSAAFNNVWVATDSGEILEYCTRAGIPARVTSTSHASGTDRLIEVLEQDCLAGHSADIYVNIQGDEPMVTADHIRLLLRPFLTQAGRRGTSDGQAGLTGAPEARSADVQVTTLKVAISGEEAKDSNAVKVVTDHQGRALYFSRAQIPFDRGHSAKTRYYKHLGFYAYTVEALQEFRTLAPSALEQAECLEQLRFLENGVPIQVIETREDTIGVDTEEDLERVQEYFSKMGPAPAI